MGYTENVPSMNNTLDLSNENIKRIKNVYSGNNAKPPQHAYILCSILCEQAYGVVLDRILNVDEKFGHHRWRIKHNPRNEMHQGYHSQTFYIYQDTVLVAVFFSAGFYLNKNDFDIEAFKEWLAATINTKDKSFTQWYPNGWPL